MPTVTHSFIPCSNGSSMLSPTEGAPESTAPRFAASMIPGPPPVMTAKPASPSRRPTSRAAAYRGSSGSVRAEPNTTAAGPRSDSSRKPAHSSS